MGKLVLFVCLENACRSQMAEAIFNKLAPKGWKAISAGSKPAKSINPKVYKVLEEIGISINGQKPKQLTEDMVEKANKVITMGCKVGLCPIILGKTEDWGIEEPSGKPIEKFREIRDKIRAKVEDLIKEIKKKLKRVDWETKAMKKILVGIIMGSDSDLPVMKEAAKILDDFGIRYEITIVSAHRTPDRMFRYAKEAEGRGLEVIIAAAGGAAHLPGMVASLTPLPVIGVPIKTPSLEGLDSLLSIVQMPAGVPVATVAINNAKNAGILSAQILGVKYPEIREKIKDFKEKLKKEVEKKAENLEKTQNGSV